MFQPRLSSCPGPADLDDDGTGKLKLRAATTHGLHAGLLILLLWLPSLMACSHTRSAIPWPRGAATPSPTPSPSPTPPRAAASPLSVGALVAPDKMASTYPDLSMGYRVVAHQGDLSFNHIDGTATIDSGGGAATRRIGITVDGYPWRFWLAEERGRDLDGDGNVDVWRDVAVGPIFVRTVPGRPDLAHIEWQEQGHVNAVSYVVVQLDSGRVLLRESFLPVEWITRFVRYFFKWYEIRPVDTGIDVITSTFDLVRDVDGADFTVVDENTELQHVDVADTNGEFAHLMDLGKQYKGALDAAVQMCIVHRNLVANGQAKPESLVSVPTIMAARSAGRRYHAALSASAARGGRAPSDLRNLHASIEEQERAADSICLRQPSWP